ncbi:barstar family protein [Aliiroseovarius sp. 2305UL8-7]|uniref:barstar family protein n=1 Tax=Aliiroseovarius conchicola TaxID=3121637 RepID=UPI003527BE68
MILRIDVGNVSSWKDFHDLFVRELGFPEFYGQNMNAWIDCMTSLDAPGDGLTTTHIEPGKVMTLYVQNAAKLKSAQPQIWEALNECSAFVNLRRIDVDMPPVLSLAYSN